MNDIISIIIPMYNAEKFIGRLLNCLKEQTYKNLEIIIVNDGSQYNQKTSKKWYKYIRFTNETKIKKIRKKNGKII